ncbi:Guanine nucleotide exchange factor LTE1 [Paramyrothecium foliicola]|nr:Guanine nucleotide exchange factor LTE1 [Paramyrothecium foliicola]
MDGPDPLRSSPRLVRDMDAAPMQHGISPPTPTSSKGTIRDVRGKPTSPKIIIPSSRDSSTPKKPVKALRIPPATGRPLLPAAERKLHMETNGTRSRKDSAPGTRADVPSDGIAAGREARQFTVANVGNNGRIYLRPSIRPAQQKGPQSNFVFPLTPPGTAGLDVFSKTSADIDDGSELLWTPTPGTSPLPREGYRFPESPDQARPTNHRRAVSDTTIRESNAAKDTDTGALKVVISKPMDEARPRTMEDVDLAHPPTLDINIPSWRLGTPRFSLKGTPLIRGSSYATTEDIHSSNASVLNHPPPVPPLPIPLLSPLTPLSPNALLSPHLDSLYSAQIGSPRYPSSIPSRPMRPTYMSARPVIEPAMFDELTFKPTCDDKSLVRYSPHTGAVTAATPSRLVAEITSPTFLDYELISDFFLTFRAFLDSQDLLRMLVARLRWAMSRTDETGTVVRVRTFVALRHWILNYFMDDFVIDYGLRVTFCNLLNDFVSELSQDGKARKVQIKILAELKKCWRRVCAHYWDGPAFDDGLGPEVVIAPGGIAGHRDPDLDPSFWEKPYPGPPRLESPLLETGAGDIASFYAEVAKAGQVGETIQPANRPRTPENQIATDAVQELGPTSPLSLASLEVVSCSFPTLSMKNGPPVQNQPLNAHPIPSTSVYNQSGPVATTPKTLIGKRVRPGHKRDNSLSDSMRERGLDKISFKDKEFLLSIPFAGSLVRGNFLPPGQAFVDVAPSSESAATQRLTTVFRSTSDDMLKDKAPGGAMSAHGMRKLIAGVRRAIGSRNQGSIPTQTSLTDITPIGPRGATTNRLPGTAVVPQELPAHEDTRPPVRVDLLGAEVAEDFKKAVREEVVAEAMRQGLPPPPPAETELAPRGNTDYSVAHMESSTFDSLPQNRKHRAASSTDLTTGSKSIFIVDATGSSASRPQISEVSSMRQSVETLTDAFLPHGGDPTPPNTPPEPSRGGTPRRSSYLLNQHMIMPPIPQEPLPQSFPGRETLGQGYGTQAPLGVIRSSASTVRRQPRLSEGTFRMHMRNKSSRSQRTLHSSGHRRHASFSSGVTPSSVRSFEATTFSEDSMLSHQFDVQMPHPLRVLRRRPGGNLRAASNINQLDPVTLPRSRSVGSLTTYSESIRDSYDVHRQSNLTEDRNDTVNASAEMRQEVFSVGQLAERQPKPMTSLFSTHSSKPIMRPSFEAEAKKLAQIPDDDDDDGGIEAALLKLEGKFTKKKSADRSADSGSSSGTDSTFSIKRKEVAKPPLISATGRQEKIEHRHLHINEETTEPESRREAEVPSPGKSVLNLDFAQRPATGARSFLSEGSQESYSSIPLLDRDLVDNRGDQSSKEWANRSILQGSDDEFGPDDDMVEPLTARPENAARLSFTFIHKTDSMVEIAPKQRTPDEAEKQSFLDDDSGNDTDLSSELSLDDFHTASTEDVYRPPSKFKLPVHPLGSPALTAKNQSDSPLGIFQQPRQTSLANAQATRHSAPKPVIHKPLALTPETTPTAPQDLALDSPGLRTPTANTPRVLKSQQDNSRRYSVHLPFILAFDSDILAQQFTLIEKDALIEIDWKELIDMTWKHAPNTDSRSWVDFLKNSDAHGVEVVIARFNLMVKWAVSEIVLTQHVEERARCIIKLIHIARHCRRYRNFATLAQLTIALTSSEVERLTRTWTLVPDHDLKTLRELEALVTPMRNFYNLRAEMEMGSDFGCIPFVGIYTHDLLYNAQRPSEIASSPSTPPLVNFERCRIAAVVVKTLLRLLEASTRYDFKPIEGITERCLWIGALTNEEIRRRSETLV